MSEHRPYKPSKRVKNQFKQNIALSNQGRHGHTGAGGAPEEKNAKTKEMVRRNPKAYAIGKSISSTRRVLRQHYRLATTGKTD